MAPSLTHNGTTIQLGVCEIFRDNANNRGEVHDLEMTDLSIRGDGKNTTGTIILPTRRPPGKLQTSHDGDPIHFVMRGLSTEYPLSPVCICPAQLRNHMTIKKTDL